MSETLNTQTAPPKAAQDQDAGSAQNPTEAPAQSTPQNAKAARNAAAGQVVIKKYANRRLYNTLSSSYVTLDHLADMVKSEIDFVVYDAKTNEDITRQVLTQIIFEAENTDQNLLPIQFLRQLIQLYGNQMQSLVPGYLEMSLDAFARQQDKMREQIGGAFATAPAYRLFEEQVRQNMSLFSQAMKMFAPFSFPRTEDIAPWSAPPPKTAPTAPEPPTDSLADLKTRIEEMQRQIERLAKG